LKIPGKIDPYRAFLFLVLAAVFVSRFYDLSAKHLWLDEIITILWAKWSPSELVTGLAGQPDQAQQPLYFIIAHYLAAAGGIWAIRVFSALFSVASVLAVFVLVSKLSSRANAAFVAFLTAISSFQLYYAQEARMYSMLMFLAIVSLSILEKSVPSGGWKKWLAFSLINTVGLYLHYFYAVFLVFEVVCGILLATKATEKRKWILGYAVSLYLSICAYSPWLLKMAGMDFAGRFVTVGQGRGVLQDLIRTLFEFGDGSEMKTYILLAFAVAGIITASRDFRKLVLYIVMFAGPILVINRLTQTHFYDPRYVIFLHPLFLLAAVEGADGFASWLADRAGPVFRTAFIAALGAILFLLSLPGIREYYAHDKRPWDAIIPVIESGVGEGDWIIVEMPDCYKEFLYYLPMDAQSWRVLLRDPIKSVEPYDLKLNGRTVKVMSISSLNKWALRAGMSSSAGWPYRST
jgi:uncharacterized membrane protein